MAFKSLKDAETFMKNMGKLEGSKTRSSSTKLSINRELIGKSFVCAKEGQTKSKTNRIKRTCSIRINCKAIMWLVLNRASKMWIVKKFIEEHNHGKITQNRLYLLKANRKVSKA